MTTPTDALPLPLIGLAKLMAMAFAGADLAPMGAELIKRAETESGGNALLDLSTVLQLRGNRELALEMQALAIRSQQVYSAPTMASAAGLRVLAVMSAGDLMANTPVEFLLEHADIALRLVFITADRLLPSELPEHDVLFVAIAQSDANMPLLQYLSATLATWPRPVLNRPERIAALSRDRVPALLADVAGLVMPSTVRVTKAMLAQNDGGLPAGCVYPVILRPVDSHAGHGLDKMDDTAALAVYLQQQSAIDPFYLSPFIDYRSADGQFRKYRVILIAGVPYLCHLAISEHWMIHYLNAGMADSAVKRAEEARAMADFATDFAARHAEALQGVYRRLGLDYLGLDCGETADGQLLIFEADSCMIVHALDPVELFPYKQRPMRTLFAAFGQLLRDSAS